MAADKPFRSARLLRAGFAVCLFLLVLGGQWAVVDRFGSAMPDWDQWDAEAVNLFAPWFEHDHFVAHLFHPHNEHRIVITKLQNLALALLNGQWDSRLECVTNAALHAALAVACWLLACRWIAAGLRARLPVDPDSGPQGRLPLRFDVIAAALFLLTAVLFGTPLAWQNVLGGFHSQQYWLLGLSFAAIVAWPFARTWSLGWWAAALAATLALGSMGSGFFAAATVAGIVLIRAVRREAAGPQVWPTLGAAAALTALGWFTHVEVPYHESLKAQSVSDFGLSIARSLEWPLRDFEWLALLLWAPWAIIAWRVARKTVGRLKTHARAELTLFALGGWILLQVVATAYARGVGGDWPASRYMDTLAMGAWINGAALAWLVATAGCPGPGAVPPVPTTDAGPKTGRNLVAVEVRVGSHAVSADARTLAAILLVTAWLIPFGCGLTASLVRNLGIELPDVKTYYLKAEAHVRGYVATGDRAQLAFDDVPYPNVDDLMARLDRPSVRALLPMVVRPPLPLSAARVEPADAFAPNLVSQLHLEFAPHAGLPTALGPLASLPTWGSFTVGGAAATGEWRSAPIRLPSSGSVAGSWRGWLKFETAGALDVPDAAVALELRAAQSDALLATVRPTKNPGNSWRAAYVRAPVEPFVVVARDRDAARWLAFSAPVEMGPLSYAAWIGAKNGLLLVYVAAGATVLLAALGWRILPPATRAFPPGPSAA